MDLAVKQLISTLEYKHSKYNDPSILLLFNACNALHVKGDRGYTINETIGQECISSEKSFRSINNKLGMQK